MRVDRREFLGSLWIPAGAAALAAFAGTRWTRAAAGVAGELAATTGTAAEIARDESFWSFAQQAFTPDRSLINLNNGGVSPSPAVVLEALKRHLDLSNTAPPWALWRVLEPRRETVRVGLARAFGCDPEEIALTRNASEGLQILQNGIELAPGDEVLTTDQDYPRMLQTFRQLERRRGIRLRTVQLPVPLADPAEVVRRYEAGLTERTRMILVCHVVNLTGQVLPVRDVVRLGRSRGIPVVVDGAHSFAHFPFRRDDLECDFFATSLHKWLFAPHGTGMLYVRKERIPEIWPLQAPPDGMDADIRKFEEIGTHPAAPYLAIGEALTFHDALGAERKAARLTYLRDRWLDRVLAHERARVHTDRSSGASYGIATFEIAGLDPRQLCDRLWNDHRILTTAIVHDDFRGIRVSPSVYTTLAEIDRFGEAVDAEIANG